MAGRSAAQLARRVTVLGAIVAANLVLAFPAAAHEVGPHQITLTPGTSGTSYTTVFTGHQGFRLRLFANFGQITNGSLFLQSVDFELEEVQNDISGGRAYIWNSSSQLTYDADRAYYYTGPYSFHLEVNQWFVGGYGPNNTAAVTIEKDNVAWIGTEPVGHRSQVTFYVP
jgi:hypothetical protein